MYNKKKILSSLLGLATIALFVLKADDIIVCSWLFVFIPSFVNTILPLILFWYRLIRSGLDWKIVSERLRIHNQQEEEFQKTLFDK